MHFVVHGETWCNIIKDHLQGPHNAGVGGSNPPASACTLDAAALAFVPHRHQELPLLRIWCLGRTKSKHMTSRGVYR